MREKRESDRTSGKGWGSEENERNRLEKGETAGPKGGGKEERK